MRRKVKSCLVYFILLMLVAFPKLVKEIEKFCSLNKSTFLVVFLLMGIAYGLCEIELLFRKKNKKMFYKIDQKKVVIFSMCLIGTLFVFGSSINNFFQNASLPAKVKIEVLSENNSARSNIWITNASINMIGKKDFIEIEENHFLSENGYPVLELEVTQIAESDILLICDNNSSDIKVTVDENKSKEYACKMIEENQKSISLLYNPGRSLCNLVVYLLAVLILSSLIYSIIYICVWGGGIKKLSKRENIAGAM